MKTSDIIILARKYIGFGVMDSSAKLCLSDATTLVEIGQLDYAKKRALQSLAYSIGRLHPDYIRTTGQLQLTQ